MGLDELLQVGNYVAYATTACAVVGAGFTAFAYQQNKREAIKMTKNALDAYVQKHFPNALVQFDADYVAQGFDEISILVRHRDTVYAVELQKDTAFKSCFASINAYAPVRHS